MKKAIICLEAVVLIALIVAVLAVVKTNLKDEAETTLPSKEPVIAEVPYDPFEGYRLEGYSSDEIFSYFTELVNNTEYSGEHDCHQMVRKWTEPIYYRIYGETTEEDMTLLTELFRELNNISYFPGIHEATDGEKENLSIYFIDRNLFDITFGDLIDHEEANGAAEHWFYTDTGEIYMGKVGYVIDTDQKIRNSVLIEEIFNVLGLADSTLRESSIVYQYSDENTEPDEIDLMILKLLYHPLIEPGMTAEECKSTALFDY